MTSSSEFSEQSMIQVSGQNSDTLQAGKFSELSVPLQGAWSFLLLESLWGQDRPVHYPPLRSQQPSMKRWITSLWPL